MNASPPGSLPLLTSDVTHGTGCTLLKQHCMIASPLPAATPLWPPPPPRASKSARAFRQVSQSERCCERVRWGGAAGESGAEKNVTAELFEAGRI